MNGMEITDVRVRKIAKEGKMKAIVSITLDDEFVVHDIKVIEGEKGLFIAMPSKKASDGEYRDIAHPINSDTRDRIQSTILTSYERALLEPEMAGEGIAIGGKGTGAAEDAASVFCCTWREHPQTARRFIELLGEKINIRPVTVEHEIKENIPFLYFMFS